MRSVPTRGRIAHHAMLEDAEAVAVILSVIAGYVKDLVVPGAGLEPARGFPQRLLRPSCLPVPPPRRTPTALQPT